MTQTKLTPMMAQYTSLKEKFPDAVLFYRMGDFYEMFNEDAIKASEILEITLTSRNKNAKDAIPMCGIPFRAAEGYISRLIENGCKVAICEQVEDPAEAKGLVKREVVRVVTPGMVLSEDILDSSSNNFILAVSEHETIGGIASLDISTGTFRVSESTNIKALMDEALRIDPSEIIIPEERKKEPFFKKIIDLFSEKAISFMGKCNFNPVKGRQKLLDQFGTISLEGFGCEGYCSGTGSAGAILTYVQDTLFQKLEHVTRIETCIIEDYLQIDETSCRNLEIIRNLRTGTKKGTLLNVVDKTVTSMGGRALKRWLRYPLLEQREIEERLDAVEEIKGKLQLRKELRSGFRSVFDLERLGSKISMGQCNARDLISLKRSLESLPNIISLLRQLNSSLFTPPESTGNLDSIASLLERSIREDSPTTITEGGIIKDGYDADLDELVQISRHGKKWLAELGAREKEKTKLSSLKIKYNKVFGYFIEVSKVQSLQVPENYQRKQTLVNAERFITDELKEFESKILGAEDKRGALEHSLFNEIRQTVSKSCDDILKAAAFIANIDCLANLAEIAVHNDYCRPEINDNGVIAIEDGRHPVVEKMITGERYVPNTIELNNSTDQIMIITGPNMAGKSTVLRQVALISILAQMGSFVPAEKASISLNDRIFTRVGALDNLSQGQSTFMVEMEETANIINNATANSLIIMDEIGRGTSTYDGLSIAWAVAEHLHDLNGKGVKTLFATHYHELTKLENDKARVKNFNIAVKEFKDNIIFLRKLVRGGTNKSYGIQVARLAGIPDGVIDNAKKILNGIENGTLDEDTTLNNAPVQETSEVQLSLFPTDDSALVEKLCHVDILKMTPLDAINCLNELKEEALKAKNNHS